MADTEVEKSATPEQKEDHRAEDLVNAAAD